MPILVSGLIAVLLPSSARRMPGMPNGTAPSQLSRFTRAAASSVGTNVSAVCRALSAWKFSTATGTGRPDASPNGPDAWNFPGPPS